MAITSNIAIAVESLKRGREDNNFARTGGHLDLPTRFTQEEGEGGGDLLIGACKLDNGGRWRKAMHANWLLYATPPAIEYHYNQGEWREGGGGGYSMHVRGKVLVRCSHESYGGTFSRKVISSIHNALVIKSLYTQYFDN